MKLKHYGKYVQLFTSNKYIGMINYSTHDIEEYLSVTRHIYKDKNGEIVAMLEINK